MGYPGNYAFELNALTELFIVMEVMKKLAEFGMLFYDEAPDMMPD